MTGTSSPSVAEWAAQQVAAAPAPTQQQLADLRRIFAKAEPTAERQAS